MTQRAYSLLLVDDDEDDFFLTQDYLSEAGIEYKLDWSSKYEDALPKMASNHYDLYLVDYRLGKHTGLELLETAIEEGCTKPVIMLTGKGDQEIDLMSMHAGAVDYLIKGEIDGSTLERAVRYALENFQNRQTIMEQQERYQMLFAQSIDPIFLTDNDLSFEEVNSSFYQLTGLKKGELEEKRLKDLFSKKEEYRNLVEEIERHNFVTNFAAFLNKSDGTEAPCLVSMGELKSQDGSVSGYQGLIHDISELRKAEADIRLAEKMSLTGKMARMIAHEVRNPLTNINLSLEQLREELEEKEEDELSMYTNIIKRNSNRINELITELLKSAKPSDLDIQPHDPNHLVKSSVEFCDDRLKLQEIKVEEKYHDLPISVKFDFEKMKIALINIVTNAIEAMEQSKGPTLKLSTYVDQKRYFISIADNGHGMTKEEIDKLFDPFYTGKSSGMGLGMTTTQNIIQSHSADIVVNSQPKIGTEFVISLPLNSQSLDSPS